MNLKDSREFASLPRIGIGMRDESFKLFGIILEFYERLIDCNKIGYNWKGKEKSKLL